MKIVHLKNKAKWDLKKVRRYNALFEEFFNERFNTTETYIRIFDYKTGFSFQHELPNGAFYTTPNLNYVPIVYDRKIHNLLRDMLDEIKKAQV